LRFRIPPRRVYLAIRNPATNPIISAPRKANVKTTAVMGPEMTDPEIPAATPDADDEEAVVVRGPRNEVGTPGWRVTPPLPAAGEGKFVCCCWLDVVVVCSGLSPSELVVVESELLCGDVGLAGSGLSSPPPVGRGGLVG